jgi:hypothetical protein
VFLSGNKLFFDVENGSLMVNYSAVEVLYFFICFCFFVERKLVGVGVSS